MVDLTMEQVETFFKVCLPSHPPAPLPPPTNPCPQLMYIGVIISSISLLLTKLSVLLLFLDIFVLSWPRRATYALIALTAVYGLWLTASNIFFCIPVHAFWEFSPERRCIPSGTKWWADAAGNLGLDIAIFCLPLPVVWAVMRTLPAKDRAWLGVVFALGFL